MNALPLVPQAGSREVIGIEFRLPGVRERNRENQETLALLKYN